MGVGRDLLSVVELNQGVVHLEGGAADEELVGLSLGFTGIFCPAGLMLASNPFICTFFCSEKQ